MSNPQDSLPTPTESVISAGIVDELKTSFLSYAMSVIVSRALPDVRDGLKPVHRRILYAMYDLGMFHAKPFKKSARIVGEVIGKYHPHGDRAVYDAMVRMAQDFSLRLPLIDGQGNFGSVDGDSPAAMRYTEARLTKAAGEILADLDKDTVEFVPNYDEQLKEPVVLATKLPNLLINGSVGIAVGMATNIPPHNVREICSALIKLIDAPESTDDELIACVSGPDFPTGGIIYGRAGILAAYKLGSGKITLRARTHIEEQKQGGKQALILDEIPYQVNKAMLIEHIADLVKDKVIEGISDIRDESDRDGMRVVIELKRDVSSEIVLNQLFKHSRLEITFGIHNLCLVNGVPKTLTLRQMLSYFLDHRFVVITKRTEFDLKKTQDRLHILEGLKIAIEQLDKAISLIRAASEPSVARVSLISAFGLDEIQAQAILDMKLQRLTALERDGILEEVAELAALAHELESILASPQKKYAIIRSELEAVADAYQSARKTEIIDSDVDVEIEDLIESRQDVVTITHEGYVKRVSLDEYRAQRRGGRGVSAATTKDTDFVEKVFSAHTKSYILFFTNTGQVHWLKVWKIPEASKVGKGKALVNLLQLTAGEKVSAAIPISEFKEDQYLLLCTKEGTVKKSSLSEYANPRMGGIRAIRLSDQDELITAVVTDGKAQIILATAKGMAIRFEEADAREVGRVSMGVRGIRLDEGDRVVSMVVANDTQSLLSITANGYGKRSPVSEYRLIGRGGKGVINIQTSERNGDVVSVQCVQDETGILLMTKGGITLRTRCDQVSVIGRNTQGVRLMRLDDGDAVVSCTVVEDVQ